jgi:CubicO group peptidase (beta-lactamase class C family)
MANAAAAATSAHGHRRRRRAAGIVGGGAGLLSMVPMNRKIIAVASAALAIGIAGAALWPKAEATLAVPAGPSWPAAAPVKAPIDALFSDAEAMGETRALLILRDGKVIYERYGPGFNQDSKLISWSMAKSITSVLIGFLVADGRLALDAPAPVAAWQRSGDPRGAITLRHLLNMSAGLEHVEEGDPAWEADTVEMLFGHGAADKAAFAEAKPAVAKAGEQFNYSSATSVILADILADTLAPGAGPAARRDAVLDFIRGRLTEPTGMTSLTPEFDAAGTMIGGSIMHATARDYAKFGELLRGRGVVDGQRLLPDSWMDFMLTPSPTNRGYGGHIWLNRPRAAGEAPRLLRGKGPNDLFACTGHQGQYIFVSPSQRLTIVRLGISRDGDQLPNVRDKLGEIIAGL